MMEIYRHNKLYKVVVRHHYIDGKETSKVDVLYVSKHYLDTAKVILKKKEEYTEKYGKFSGIIVRNGFVSELTYRDFKNTYNFTLKLEAQ